MLDTMQIHYYSVFEGQHFSVWASASPPEALAPITPQQRAVLPEVLAPALPLDAVLVRYSSVPIGTIAIRNAMSADEGSI